jgi:lipopolysaccharide transport system ATP-binding protein
MPGFKKHGRVSLMSSDDIAICVTNLSKRYEIYESPRDRLKQFLLPKIQKKFRKSEKQYFRDFWALKDVSFVVKKGETVGIIGRNGCGKSTLLQMICGTLTPTNGSIRTEGRIAALLELGSGFNPEFTGRENVYMNAVVLGLNIEEVDSRFDAIIAFADIGEFIEQPVKMYSSGMAVRLAFAVIAHVDADILVIDEALAVGDTVFTQKCMRFINEFKKNGTILFVSHDIGAISSISDNVVWLSQGEICSFGAAPDVIEQYHQYTLNEIMGFHSNKNASEIQFEKIKSKEQQHRISIDQINQINPNATIVGQGKAKIVSAKILDEKNDIISMFSGNEILTLTFKIKVYEDIYGFLAGFTIKDRLGMKIIEENNSSYSRNEKINIEKNSVIVVSFDFKMPFLRTGTYSIDLSVAEGTQDKHVPQTWVYDAIQIEFKPSQEVFGLVSTGLTKFILERNND